MQSEAAPAAGAQPANQAPGVALLVSAVYLGIFVVGVVGNLCNCLVIADARNRYMKSATNYYLFSLSVSDLLLLLFGIPHDLVDLWHPTSYLFSEFVCVSRGWISEASTNASVLVIVAFTVERYLAICHPFRWRTFSRLSRSVKIIALIWVLASSCALLLVRRIGLVVTTAAAAPGEQVVVQCTTLNQRDSAADFELSSLLFFVLPMLIISLLYMRICCYLNHKTTLIARNRRLNHLASHQTPRPITTASTQVSRADLSSSSSSPAHTSSSSSSGSQAGAQQTGLSLVTVAGGAPPHLGRPPEAASDTGSAALQPPEAPRGCAPLSQGNPQQQRGLPLQSTVNTANMQSVIKMLVSVVVMFFICWAPFHAQRLMAVYVTDPTPDQEFIYAFLNHISGISYYISALVNPILYSLFSVKFRQAFRDTFGRLTRRGAA